MRHADTGAAIAELANRCGADQDPAFVCAFYDADHDDVRLGAFLRERFPDAALIGGTSCCGVMTDDGLGGSGSIGLLIVDDVDGNYGTAAVRLDGDPADCAERALRAALQDADCEGELPELIWIYQAPGSEEQVISGFAPCCRRSLSDHRRQFGGQRCQRAMATSGT
ncbi:MAG: FIST N-terminal domain-containing protein [Burkholderiaceae bacterium]